MFWTQIAVAFGILAAILTTALNILFAVAVYLDAQSLIDREKLRTVLVPAYIWALATLVGGVFVAVGYWVVHRSSVARLEQVSSDFDIRDHLG